MTKSMSPSLDMADYLSVDWHDSAVCQGVYFATRRMSLAQRIELTKQVRELTMRNEFLRGGEISDQLEATLGELLCRRLYLEWGLAEIRGFTIDGNPVTPTLLIEKGPEVLSEEIAGAILASMTLSDEERKNF
ncbi:MAG TPA: hypothetical protein VFA65_16115 [Bryobacteraceae bacterium]|nr:hypothetical protein [Bryobacteraceae bacterium]